MRQHLVKITVALVALFVAPACSSPSEDDVVDDSGSESALSGPVMVGTKLVTTARVNLRSGPGTSFSVVRVLAKGTTVVVTAAQPQGPFYAVAAGGDAGFVHGRYLVPLAADAGTLPTPDGAAPPSSSTVFSGGPGRGFPSAGPWVSFYGPATGVDLAKTAATFRVINIDADPGAGNFTNAELLTLKNGGVNRVISYLNLGSCETYRSYWAKCLATGALTTLYDGYPDERWANLSNAAYRKLMVEDVAQKLAERGVDGFFLDNLEVVEHGASSTNGPCDTACAQGGLDLVYELRARFPKMLIVMQNATGTTTRNGTTHGVPFRSLLDGISHEEVYASGGDANARAEMLAWKALGITVAGRPLWLAVEDYVGACSSAKKPAATTATSKAAADGLSSYVTDESGEQQKPCFWSDL